MNNIYLETLKYLGVKGEVDSNLKTTIEECILEVQNAINFKSCHKLLSVEVVGDSVMAEKLVFNSKSLATFLKNAKKVIIYSATLGAKVDKILNGYSKIDVYKQVVIQAVSTAIIEDKINIEQENFKKFYANYTIKSRFSPGYGDLSLKYQPLILKELNAQKNCGIYLNENNVLLPSKSVTAIIGLF